jgi:hypothetical protein
MTARVANDCPVELPSQAIGFQDPAREMAREDLEDDAISRPW